MSSIDLCTTRLPASEQEGLKAFAAAVTQALPGRVTCVALYGSALRHDFVPGRSDVNVLIVVDRAGLDVLQALAEPVFDGKRFGVDPFLLTEEEVRGACDVFPGKLLAMRDSYCLLHGRDVLAGIEVRREHLRLRCEQEARNLLIRLRMRHVARAGRGLPDAIAETARPFFETLRTALAIGGDGALPDRDRVADLAAERFAIDGSTIREVMAMKAAAERPAREAGEALFGRYLDAIGALVAALDSMG